MFNLRLVCEGPTDQAILESVLSAHLNSTDFKITRLQPDESRYGGDAGPHGGGWKGVRSWCQSVQAAGGLEAIGALRPDIDLLMIHVDADIVFEPEHDVNYRCPPPENNILAAEAIVMTWLGLPCLPNNVLIWVPGMATEAWLLRAIFPELPESRSCLTDPLPPACVECIEDPSAVLEGKRPKFVRRKGNDLRKIPAAYRDAHPVLAEAWGGLVDSLWSAGRLQQGLSRCLPATT
jgi:hypothetical protein